MPTITLTVSAEQAGATLAAVLRTLLPGCSWSDARRLVSARRVRVGDDLCLDPARRLREGDVVELLSRSAPKPPQQHSITVRYLDEHLVVVEKPSGISTVRHPTERDWPARRKALSPTLEDLVLLGIAREEGKPARRPPPRLRIVQRLDKDTSGLLVFARTVTAERGLGKQFRAHTVMRRYLALVSGYVPPQRIASRLVRDRGDGKRGSTTLPGLGKESVTFVEVAERLKRYTLLSCRLETGRTHQIRIHLAELGHPVCGDKVYRGKFGQPPIKDASDAPRLVLHAAELGIVHPASHKEMHWTMSLPADLSGLLERLRGPEQGRGGPR